MSDLILPCRVIEKKDTGALQNAEVQDIIDHESIHGRIPEGCAVLFNFSWAKYWNHGSAAYLGFDEAVQGKYNPDTSKLAFPGISPDASSFLVSRKVKAVGLDTASLDPGACKNFISHRILLENGIYGIENINGHLPRVPARGATLMVMPMKLTGGTGAPARVVAFLPPPR